MMYKIPRGLFVTFDGPNFAGKTSVLRSVSSSLKKSGLNVADTREPTHSPLGEFVRQAEEVHKGKVFACLVAADRYFHLENEVLPSIADHRIVLSDRYVESSLVLQRLDGLELELIWGLNSHVLIPDLSVILVAASEILESRMAERTRLSRFERTSSRAREIELYSQAAEFLKSRGFNVLVLENGNASVEANVQTVVVEIMRLLARAP